MFLKLFTLRQFVIVFIAAILIAAIFSSCAFFGGREHLPQFENVDTLARDDGKFGEAFGIAFDHGAAYFSDGKAGKIWKIGGDKVLVDFAAGLKTPSAIAFDKGGDIIAADSGSHTIKRIAKDGSISVIAGIENTPGHAAGPALSAMFNAPIGVAIMDDGSIVVADTYNDKIKMIKDGMVSTIAGSTRGFADGVGPNAKFDTPCGVAAWKDGRILVADTNNHRIRVIEQDGRVWTLAGNGEDEAVDGLVSEASFARPMSVTAGTRGEIYVADGNTIRAIGRRSFPFIETIAGGRRGFADGTSLAARFDRISGLAVNEAGELIAADSGNAAIRILDDNSTKQVSLKYIDLRTKPDAAAFRSEQPGRWPFEPPAEKRDIAGTLGELRGEIEPNARPAHYHNGLDIAGSYGETAYFIRNETVLDPFSAENFGTTRELLRLPTIGYIHVRLGRSSEDLPFGDNRFHFLRDASGKIADVRVPRGAVFNAGDRLGTLNSMNHVHLIAGPVGAEMNALDALDLPGISDSIAPVIENAALFDENWMPLETKSGSSRIILSGKTRVVVRAYDRMDGNSERRRLGVFSLGYQIFNSEGTALSEPIWNIRFGRNPLPESLSLVYANGSHSGATGETIFNYIVTNRVDGENFAEGFLDASQIAPGQYTIRVFAIDYFGNTSTKDISVEVTK